MPTLSAKQDYHDGMSYFRDEDYEMAFECLSDASKSGYDLAHYQLGLLYEEGLGVELDDDQALHCFKKAHEANDLSGSTALIELAMGVRYNPEGEPVSDDLIIDLMPYLINIAESEKGNDAFLYFMGTLYEEGRLVKKSRSKAYDYYERGAYYGYPPSLEKMKGKCRNIFEYLFSFFF